MRISGVIVAVFLITLQRARTNDERDERILEKINFVIDGDRFERLVSLNLCDVGNTSAVPDEGALSYRSVFNLIPNENLTNVPAGTWTTLCNYFGEDVGFVSKVMDTLENDERRVNFLIGIRAPVTLDLDSFTYGLAYAAAAAEPADAFWRHRSPLSRRTWSKILLQSRRFAVSLIEEHENSSFFRILNTVNTIELQDLLTALHVEQTVGSAFFFSTADWNTVQIRKIVDFFFERFNNSLATDICDKFLSRLLPVQIARAVQTADITPAYSQVAISAANHLQNVNQVSLPQALQLAKYFITSFTIDESNCESVGKLLYSQTNSFFSQLYDETLKMKIIKCLDSDKYSALQAHYILGRNGLRDVKDYLLNLKGLIAAIPASYYFDLVKTSKRDDSLENHFIHVLKYFPSRANKIAASAALHACKIVMDAGRCIESVLENDDNEVISAMISAFDIRQNVDDIWHSLGMKAKNDNEFKQRVAYLPSFVLTELLRKKELVITYNQLFNETYPIHLTITGLNCEILSRIPVSDFLPIFEFYNRQRKLYNKEFPKDLQNCARDVFLNYLRMKLNTSVTPLKANLLQYLDLADIRSVGGYILTTLPPKSIAKSKHHRNIVEEIGRLSLPELMLAATRSHLVSITSQYLNELLATAGQNEGIIRAEHLVTLGNLTHFLNDDYVRKIDSSALKLMLEAEFIDTRVCACSTIRRAWADKLIEAFGWPETWDENAFLKIGDMLIVIAESSLRALNETTGSRVVDSINSKYKRFVEWIPRRLSFYEVCRLILPQNEQAAYQSSVTNLALFYAASIQRLLDTVVEPATVWPKNVALRFADTVERSASTASETTTTYDSAYADKRILADTSTANAVDSNRTATATVTDTAETRTDPAIRSSEGTSTTITPTDDDRESVNANNSSFTSRTSSPWQETDTVAVTSINASTGGATIKTTRDGQRDDDRVGRTVTSTEGDWSHASERFPPIKTDWPASTFSIGRTSTDDAPTATSPETEADSGSDNDAPTTTVAVAFDDDDDDGGVSNISSPVASTGQDTRQPVVTYTGDSSWPDWEPTSAVASSAFYSTTAATVDETPVVVARNTRDANTFDGQTTVAVAGIQVGRAAEADLSLSLERDRDQSIVDEQQRNHQLEQDLRYIMRGLSARDATTAEENRRTVQLGYHRYQRSKRDDARQKLDHGDGGENRLIVGCDTLRMLDDMSDFILASSRIDIKEQDSLDCVELFSRMDNLSAERRRIIWSGVAPALSKANLTFAAGKILSGADEADFWTNFIYDAHSAGALELLSAVSQVSQLWSNANQSFEKLIQKILRDNRGSAELARDPRLPIFARAFGKLVCHLESPMYLDLFKRNDSLANMWTTFDALGDDCPKQCLQRIANTTVKVYGEPLDWEPSFIATLGPVAAAIPNLRQRWNVSRYFSASAFACLRVWSDLEKEGAPIAAISTKTSTSVPLSLTASMILAQTDCQRIDRCPFTSSLAGTVLSEDSLQLRVFVPAPADSSTGSSSRPFALSLYLVVVAFVVRVCTSISLTIRPRWKSRQVVYFRQITNQ